MPGYDSLISEAMRPIEISDLTLPAPLLAKLKSMIVTKSVLNMIFHGAPGTGKTSAARLIAEGIKATKCDVNGALNSGITTVMGDLAKWASGVSIMLDEPRLCIIDEADQLSRKHQTALSHIIENSSGRARFILTTNCLSRLCGPLQSRCEPIGFDVRPADYDQAIAKVTDRWLRFIAQSGLDIPSERCREIVRIYFPDLRRVGSQMQLETAK